jgi:hypothetical protein
VGSIRLTCREEEISLCKAQKSSQGFSSNLQVRIVGYLQQRHLSQILAFSIVFSSETDLLQHPEAFPKS